jgi:hypothetical protein
MVALRLTALLAVLGSAVALAGCGGGSGSTSAEAITFEQLAEAASSSADATSGRFEFSFEMTTPDLDEPFAFSGNGVFDTSADRAQIALDFSSFAKVLGGIFGSFAGPGRKAPDFGDVSAWQIDAVQDGDVMYMRFPALSPQLPAGKSWVRMAVDEAAKDEGFNFSQLQDATNNDPRKLLEFLRAASGEIETVGTEELRGVSTTHYRAQVDLRKYETLVPPDKREELRSTMSDVLARTGLAELPVDVWLDEQGLVRKVVMSLSATDPSSGDPVAGSIGFELWDYGQDVDIEVPPAAEVVDASQID